MTLRAEGRQLAGLPGVLGRVPGRPDHPPAVRGPHPAGPRAAGRPADRSHRHPGPPEAQPVPRPRAHRAQRGRLQAVADLRHPVGGAVLRHPGRAAAPRRARPDQPDLAVRAVRALPGELPGPARLVHRLGGGGNAYVPALGVPSARVPGPQPVRPRRAGPGGHLRPAVPVAVPGALADPRPGRPPAPAPAPRPPGALRGRGRHPRLLRAAARHGQQRRDRPADSRAGRRPHLGRPGDPAGGAASGRGRDLRGRPGAAGQRRRGGVLQVSFGQLAAAARATVRRRHPPRGARGRRPAATIAGGSEDR
jgi:hypothetical protein